MLCHSELDKFEEVLVDYKRYKELLFKLSPPEWQEAQKTKALKDLADRAQNRQNTEPVESPVRNGKYMLQFETGCPKGGGVAVSVTGVTQKHACRFGQRGIRSRWRAASHQRDQAVLRPQ